MSELVQLNALKSDHGIYHFGDQAFNFGYSDGRASEIYLRQVLSTCDDLNSHSKPLQQHIIDWPSEYHLSWLRANILRGLNLSGVSRVLELGSGCGAITRYLAESGCRVDAIEGSEIRAELCRMRCQEFDNVHVIHANYNDLKIPQRHYDLVLFIGVIEYAKRFYPDAVDEHDATRKILAESQKWLTLQGVTLVAIENRLGQKYQMGYDEDHYHKAYAGIHNYPERGGMMTYSRSEWQQLIDESNYTAQELLLPFPDYKLPQVVMRESFAEQNPYAFNHLEGIFARDYTGVTERSIKESIAWQSYSQAGMLARMSNSFFWLLGNDQQRINQIANVDFYHGPSYARQKGFVMDTIKYPDSDVVNKRHVFDVEPSGALNFIHKIAESKLLDGNLLSTEWLRTIFIFQELDRFNQLLKDYYAYLQSYQAQYNRLPIDLLPINIIVSETGEYIAFDQEWHIKDDEVSADYLLFRALLTFAVRYGHLVSKFFRNYQITTIYELLQHGFHVVCRPLLECCDDYIADETSFMSYVCGQDDAAGDLHNLLNTTLEQGKEEPVYSELLLSGDGKTVSQKVEHSTTIGQQTLLFEFKEKPQRISQIEFKPFDTRSKPVSGCLRLLRIQAIALAHAEQPERALFDVAGEKVGASIKAENLDFFDCQDEKYWVATSDYPRFICQLPELDLIESSAVGVMFKVTLEYFGRNQFNDIRRRYIDKNNALEVQLKTAKDHIKYLGHVANELHEIKSGRAFRYSQRLINLLTKFKW